MIYLSEKLIEKKECSEAVHNLLEALEKSNTSFRFVHNTKDIWMRDFMPIRTKSGRYVSFRYAPSYLNRAPELRTEFSRDIAPQLGNIPGMVTGSGIGFIGMLPFFIHNNQPNVIAGSKNAAAGPDNDIGKALFDPLVLIQPLP